jgi:hypothetical protein
LEDQQGIDESDTRYCPCRCELLAVSVINRYSYRPRKLTMRVVC